MTYKRRFQTNVQACCSLSASIYALERVRKMAEPGIVTLCMMQGHQVPSYCSMYFLTTAVLRYSELFYSELRNNNDAQCSESPALLRLPHLLFLQ